MGSRRSAGLIDLAIDEKISSSFVLNYPKKHLFNFSRKHNDLKFESLQFGNALPNLNLEQIYESRKDHYNNEIHRVLNFQFNNTQSRFNLLRLFKPGELLSSIANS